MKIVVAIFYGSGHSVGMKTETMNAKWTVSNIEGAASLRPFEFQDDKGEWQSFELLCTPERVVFGCCCNVGFLESGYIIREAGESLYETLYELADDLRAYYNDGPQYVSRIVCNERM